MVHYFSDTLLKSEIFKNIALRDVYKRQDMKAIKVAIFFEMMKRLMIQYSFDELQGTTFRSHFSAIGLGDTQERNGFFLAAYITDNSVLQDGFIKGVRTYLDDAVVYKYDSPYQEKDVLEKELMYIIEIKNED